MPVLPLREPGRVGHWVTVYIQILKIGLRANNHCQADRMSATNQGLTDPPHRGNEHSDVRAEDESVHSQVGSDGFLF